MAKYQTTVWASVIDLMSIDDPIANNIIGVSSIKHNYPINRELWSVFTDGIAPKMNRVQSYGESTYTYGLPQGYEVNTGYDVNNLKDAVEEDLGYEVVINGSYLAIPEPLDFVRDYAQKTWGWKENTGLLTYPPLIGDYGKQVTLLDGYADQLGNVYAVLQYEKKDLLNQVEFIEVNELLPFKLYQDSLYYHVRYLPVGVVGIDDRFWFYKMGGGTYPNLDLSDIDLTSPYLPIVPIREDNVNLGPTWDDNGAIVSRPTTDLYKTSKFLCKITNVKFDDLCKSVHDSPTVDDIDHAYLIYGIDIRSTKKAAKSYLYQFFNDLAVRDLPSKSIEVKDAKYRIAIKYDSCEAVTKSGTIPTETVVTYQDNIDGITIQHRITDSTYREVVATGVHHYNYIYGDHNVDTSLRDSADEENKGFIIPLNYELSKLDRSLMARENLYRESFKIVFNSYHRRKLKWYESGWFKFVLIIVAVALAVWTGGQSLTALSAMYAQMGVLYTIAYAAVMIAAGMAIKFGLNELAKALGPEWALALAVVAAIATSQMGGTFSFDLGGMTVATDMLTITTGIIDSVQVALKDEADDLGKEIEDWTSYAEGEESILEEWNEALDVNSFLSPWDFLYRPQLFIADEQPEEFYNRMIHAGNIGVATLNQQETFVEGKLELPRVKIKRED